jgi:hypothetical protein
VGRSVLPNSLAKDVRRSSWVERQNPKKFFNLAGHQTPRPIHIDFFISSSEDKLA